ncbi:MAG: DUF262 domain-containing protein [Candidatus Gracilibacteria bacterium]
MEIENIKLNKNTEDIIIDYDNHDTLEDDFSQAPSGITSYSTSITIDSLIPRLKKGYYYIPPFQRSYVWTNSQASKLIESIFLGLPIPSIFLGQDADSNKYFVIDGQQRLMSLLKFYQDDFKLSGIDKRWKGKKYSDLTDTEQFQLGDFSIHAIIVKEGADVNDDSIYQIFERINTGGVNLQAQEIRASSYHGKFNDLLNKLAENKEWDDFIQLNKSRQKPQELILRFFALNFDFKKYKPTMKTFMNLFMKKNRNPSDSELEDFKEIFSKTIKILATTFEKNDFVLPPSRVINTQLLDSVMIGIAQNISNKNLNNSSLVLQCYNNLKNDKEYIEFCNSRKSTQDLVNGRIAKTIDAFGNI